MSKKEEIVSSEENEQLNDCEHKPFTRADFIREQKQASSNIVHIGCIVAEKEEKKGSERKDKDGKFMLGQDNQPLLYPTKFYVTLTFMGGTIRTEVNPIQYENLTIGLTYFCKGRIATVKDFGKESLAPVFSEFVELYRED